MPILRQPYTTTLQTIKKQNPLTAYIGRVETDYSQDLGVEIVEVVKVNKVEPTSVEINKVDVFRVRAGVEMVEVVKVNKVKPILVEMNLIKTFKVRAGVQEGNRPINRPIKTNPVKDSDSL
jgi:hypothetical protein